MAHVAKYRMTAVGHLCNHYARSESMELSACVVRKNECIDTSKTALNYNLAKCLQPMEQLDFIHRRLSEVKVQKRADVNVLCDWVVTMPKDLPRYCDRQFFKAAYDFLEKKYGSENVVSAYVHMDETTPHMHFAFIPVVPDHRRGGFKVSAKEAITRKDLQVFHQELSQHISREFRLIGLSGLEINVLNGATKEGNRSIADLKRESAIERLQKTTEEATRIISEAKEQAMKIEMTCKGIEAEYSAKKAYVDACDTSSEVSMAIPDYAVVKKSLFSNKETITVPKEKWIEKHISVNEKQYVKEARQELEKKINDFKKEVSSERLESLERQVEQLKKENHELRLRNSELESENETLSKKLQDILSWLPPDVANQFRNMLGKIERENSNQRKQKSNEER